MNVRCSNIDLEDKLEAFNVIRHATANSRFLATSANLPCRHLILRKTRYWNLSHLCISGYRSSVSELKVQYYVDEEAINLTSIYKTPHYDLAKHILNVKLQSIRRKERDFRLNINDYQVNKYMNYIKNQYRYDFDKQSQYVGRFIRLTNSIYQDLKIRKSNLVRGEIVVKINGNYLQVEDGFNRLAILAALEFKVIPIALFVKTLVKSNSQEKLHSKIYF